jgi:hypothetical protein
MNATALLSLLLSNPQLQQALRAAPVLGQAGPQAMSLGVPTASGGQAQAAIPIASVMNLIAALASRSTRELVEAFGEDEATPDYLLDEYGGRLVDPGVPEQQAAVALQYFRLAGESVRFSESDEDETSLDESDRWLMEAGLEDWGIR